VALREFSWKIANNGETELIPRWHALIWLLNRTEERRRAASRDTADYRVMQKRRDRLARSASSGTWSRESTAKLAPFAGHLNEEFRTQMRPPNSAAAPKYSVLALDRLWQPLKKSGFSSPTLDTALGVPSRSACADRL